MSDLSDIDTDPNNTLGRCLLCETTYERLPGPLALAAEVVHAVVRHRQQFRLADEMDWPLHQTVRHPSTEWECPSCGEWNRIYRDTGAIITCPECTERFTHPADVRTRSIES